MTVTLKLTDSSADAYTRRVLVDISLSVAKSKKIVVITGAGISCSCGIPDFRSSDGLYALVKQQHPDVLLRGRDLFDASLFRDATSTAIFYTFISKLKQSIDAASPTPTHRFIKMLDTRKKLLRSYTQNIDGLEERVGLVGSSSSSTKSNVKGKSKIKAKDVRNVQLHGDVHRVRCISCSAEYPCTNEHLVTFLDGRPPDCPECTSRAEARIARSARATRIGTLRPSIVLYDEPHPLGDEIGDVQTFDMLRKPEMLIIMGTSLKVHGLRKMVKEFAKVVHTSACTGLSHAKTWKGKVIFVNKTPPSSEWNDIIDYHVEGETDAWVGRVTEDWKKMRPADWEVQQTLVAVEGDISMTGKLKTVKETVAHRGKAKKGREEENIVPRGLTDMVLSTPDNKSEQRVRTVDLPLSPSKRQQTAAHYNNVESSPSKRRVSSSKGSLRATEKKTLFSECTNKCGDSGDVFGDLSMQDINSKPEPPVVKEPQVDHSTKSNSRSRKLAKRAVVGKVF